MNRKTENLEQTVENSIKLIEKCGPFLTEGGADQLYAVIVQTLINQGFVV